MIYNNMGLSIRGYTGGRLPLFEPRALFFLDIFQKKKIFKKFKRVVNQKVILIKVDRLTLNTSFIFEHINLISYVMFIVHSFLMGCLPKSR